MSEVNSEHNDQLVCPGFARDTGQESLPRVTFAVNDVAEIKGAGDSRASPQVHDTVAGWTLMGTFERAGRPIAVLEEIGLQESRIAFVDADGPVRVAAKSLEPTSEGEAGLRFHGIRSWYRGYQKADVLPNHRDVLREELLAGGRDPSFDDVAARHLAARHAFFEGHLRPHTFVGTGISADVVPIYYQDVPMVSRVPIGVVAPGSERAMQEGELWEGLVGSWTPIIRTAYPIGAQASWEVTSFASGATANEFKQPVWYRFVRLERGRIEEVKDVDCSCRILTLARTVERYYEELLATLEYWDRELDGGMTVTGWDTFSNRSRHAFAREIITRRGVHPKYGIADQAYAGAEHDGFQDVLVSSVFACLEWGYFDRTRAYLDDYFRHFVRLDGTLHYRGPEMGKYGVSLTCLGLYYDYSRDASLLLEHSKRSTRWSTCFSVAGGEHGNGTCRMQPMA